MRKMTLRRTGANIFQVIQELSSKTNFIWEERMEILGDKSLWGCKASPFSTILKSQCGLISRFLSLCFLWWILELRTRKVNYTKIGRKIWHSSASSYRKAPQFLSMIERVLMKFHWGYEVNWTRKLKIFYGFISLDILAFHKISCTLVGEVPY